MIGALLSLSGTAAGLALGRSLCGLLQWKSIIDLPADVYFFTKIPVDVRPLEWVFIAIGAVLLAVLSTLWPSYSVSRQNLIEGLRQE
jgi:lipoprotein-releasing system permease protein